GVEIREAEVLQAQQGTLYNAVSEGPVAAQLQRLLVDDLVRQEVVRQAAAPMRVTNAQVRAEVDAFREANGLAGRRNDSAYLARLRQVGFTDQTFRDYLREQLKLQAWQDSVLGDVAVTDAEIEAYYLSHQSSYQSEERVRARQIVVSDRETAEDIRARVAAGESFAELAAEHSLELADRQGAVGAPARRARGVPDRRRERRLRPQGRRSHRGDRGRRRLLPRPGRRVPARRHAPPRGGPRPGRRGRPQRQEAGRHRGRGRAPARHG